MNCNIKAYERELFNKYNEREQASYNNSLHREIIEMKETSVKFITIGTIKNNQCIDNNAVRSTDSYTEEELKKLFRNEEIPVDWDEDGNPIEWEYLCMDKMDEEEEE